MSHLEQDLTDAHFDTRYGAAHRTWPGAPNKSRSGPAPDSTLPRYDAVQRSARDIGYREGERAGVRFGWYWGLVSGCVIGSTITASALFIWLAYFAR